MSGAHLLVTMDGEFQRHCGELRSGVLGGKIHSCPYNDESWDKFLSSDKWYLLVNIRRGAYSKLNNDV